MGRLGSHSGANERRCGSSLSPLKELTDRNEAVENKMVSPVRNVNGSRLKILYHWKEDSYTVLSDGMPQIASNRIIS